MAPVEMDGTADGGWHRQASRLHLVSDSLTNPTLRSRTFGSLADLGGWHRQRWMAPGDVLPRGSARRRCMRCLHEVPGTVYYNPPDPKKPHNRLVGRIGCQAPCWHSKVGGTGKGGWHREGGWHRWRCRRDAEQGCQRAGRPPRQSPKAPTADPADGGRDKCSQTGQNKIVIKRLWPDRASPNFCGQHRARANCS